MDDQITVFRSADESASEDAANVQQMLIEEGIAAALLDDSAAGVLEGTYEVRVDVEDRARAEQLIAQAQAQNGNPSHRLDLVTVFRSAGAANDMEALSVQSVLEAGGISAFVVGASRSPDFPQVVRVARGDEAKAKQLIDEALAAGSSAAEEAEAEGEKH